LELSARHGSRGKLRRDGVSREALQGGGAGKGAWLELGLSLAMVATIFVFFLSFCFSTFSSSRGDRESISMLGNSRR
jgi:hypothetical protein